MILWVDQAQLGSSTPRGIGRGHSGSWELGGAASPTPAVSAEVAGTAEPGCAALALHMASLHLLL